MWSSTSRRRQPEGLATSSELRLQCPAGCVQRLSMEASMFGSEADKDSANADILDTALRIGISRKGSSDDAIYGVLR